MTERAELLEELAVLNHALVRRGAEPHPEILTRHLSDSELLEVVLVLEMRLRDLERVQAEQSHHTHRGDD
ncbi:MAG: hypothetical protein J2P28_02820 [Actinobacteria bacterium]|nr:hypothetical protein [Actinomycetota bacterium]